MVATGDSASILSPSSGAHALFLLPPVFFPFLFKPAEMKFATDFTALLVVLLFHVRSSTSSHPKPSCRYPPSQWCRSLEIAIECKVQKQCMELSAVRPQEGAPPVSVTLYYESLCPACRVFITQQLFPTWTMLQDIMKVTLVPYGNAKELVSGNTTFRCQHGESECHGNMIEACILYLSGPTAFQTIYCMESAADVLSAAQPCLQMHAPAVSWVSVDSCVKGGLGRKLMHDNAVMTRALSPPHTHVPWVTFNGEFTEEYEDKAMSSLFTLVCNLYKGVKPPTCNGALVRLDRGFC
ncbi:gamma-interferon-inducible lysosomal thiol reductase-like isoform X2 [Corythoichthys intestinalis]|uniref:gamma-interferon-inducible lysosomal thiol reductase-like isoform X2 n=1 Tax=Corythoichthys intestinalis TaxID=161448 RepID=UPI0025A5407E|nr:gamma-interferon-inducible lysosomal thiol reductase-like isoform X2 [Corythoichthys intestinalis]